MVKVITKKSILWVTWKVILRDTFLSTSLLSFAGVLGGDKYFWSEQFGISSYSTEKGGMAVGVSLDDWNVSFLASQDALEVMYVSE